MSSWLLLLQRLSSVCKRFTWLHLLFLITHTSRSQYDSLVSKSKQLISSYYSGTVLLLHVSNQTASFSHFMHIASSFLLLKLEIVMISVCDWVEIPSFCFALAMMMIKDEKISVCQSKASRWVSNDLHERVYAHRINLWRTHGKNVLVGVRRPLLIHDISDTYLSVPVVAHW